MLIFDPGFPTEYQRRVENARSTILNKLPPTTTEQIPKDLLEGLRSILDGTQYLDAKEHLCPYESIVSRCVTVAYDIRSDGPCAYTSGCCIWLCERTFDEDKKSPDRLAAVLLHELVHVLCGWELDAEVFENQLFSGHGATRPDIGDLECFARKNWRGRWVRVVKKQKDVVAENLWGQVILRLGNQLQEFSSTLSRNQLNGFLESIPKD